MFQHVDTYAGDPILSLMEEFGKDERTEKVNLSIGLYYNEDNIVPQLNAVKAAYKNIKIWIWKATTRVNWKFKYTKILNNEEAWKVNIYT